MACTIENRHRRGALLVVVAGLLAILVALVTVFFLRVRSEAARSQQIEQTARARLMLNAALQYLQEASRIGYGVPSDPANHYGLVRIGAKDPIIDPLSADDKNNRYWSYPDGFDNPSLVPASGDFWDPPSQTGALPRDGWNGGYSSAKSAIQATEKSWVGWYSPVHRGLFKDFWANMEWENPLDVRSPSKESWPVKDLAAKEFQPATLGAADFGGAKTYQDIADHLYLGAGGYEARIRSQPIPTNGASALRDPFAGPGPPPADWGSQPWLTDARYRIRAELVEIWPVGGPPKLFPMYMLRQPPFAIIPKQACVSTWHLKKTGGAYYTNHAELYPTAIDTQAWADLDQPLPPLAEVFPTLAAAGRKSWTPAVRDPPIRHTGDYHHWLGLGSGTAADLNGVVDGVAQYQPRTESLGLSWFRIYRETPDTFIITVGGGPTMGFSLKQDGTIETSATTRTPGIDVISPIPCPYATAEDLRLAMTGEVRMWFRVTWNPGVGVKRGLATSMGCAQGGTFTMIQRLREREIGPPSLPPVKPGDPAYRPRPTEAARALLQAVPENASAPGAVCPTW